MSCPDLTRGLKYRPQEYNETHNLTPPDSDDENDEELWSIRTLFRTSTPIEDKDIKRLPYPVNIADILHDPRGIQVPPQDIVAAPGL